MRCDKVRINTDIAISYLYIRVYPVVVIFRVERFLGHP